MEISAKERFIAQMTRRIDSRKMWNRSGERKRSVDSSGTKISYYSKAESKRILIRRAKNKAAKASRRNNRGK